MIIRPAAAFKIVALFCLLLFSCAPRHAVIKPGSGMPTDPAIVYGMLPNGFQYILMENSKPEDRVDIHLDVFAGSMNETDEQQGIAHYLEHMLFNGSEHFKPGELIEYFQSIGMDFGADANARTSFFNTVYDLSLPKADKQHMDDAFIVIQDYAQGALLLETEVDRERGIILAEKRERDSVSYRTVKKQLEFELPGSFYHKRLPIGIEEVIKKADQKLLKSYYEQWYRPDNMVLIAVGDFDTEMVVPMITKRFSQLKSNSLFMKKALPTKWKEHNGIKAFYHYEPEAGSTEISIETVEWEPFKMETVDILKKRTLNDIADAILQNRLSRMISKQTADFSQASVFSGSFLHHLSLSSINAVCQPGNWKKVLQQIEGVLRQGLLYGFSQKELDRVKADFITAIEKQYDLSESRKSPDISMEILEAVNQKKLILSPKQKKDILVPYIKSISLDQAHDALKKTWSKNHRLVLLSGNVEINGQAPKSTVLEVYQNSLKNKIEPYKENETKKFPYLELPSFKYMPRYRKDNVKNLGITIVEFENNIRMNLKRTDFKKNEILFKVCFGQGKKAEPVSNPGLSLLTESVLRVSGLGKLDADELDEALAGSEVTMGFGIDENYFSLSGSANPKESLLMFQLIYHYLNDPGFRVQALDMTKTRYRQQYDANIRTPEGIMQIKGNRFLAGNDTRFGLANPDTIDNYLIQDIKDWIYPYLQNAPVEISIIGDFSIEDMIHTASKYIGAFKKRQSFPDKPFDPGKIYFPKGKHIQLKLDTKIDAGVVHIAFPTDDFWDIKQTRRLSILSRVLSERFRLIVREDLGETYSSYAYNEPSMGFKGYGVLHMVVNTEPEKQQFVYDKIENIIDDIILNGISKDETQLALKPVLSHIKILRKTNSYWLNSVMANSSNYPQRFEWALNMPDDYSSINEDDLELLAKKYLNKDKSAVINIKSTLPSTGNEK